jgi:hypothetical protein
MIPETDSEEVLKTAFIACLEASPDYWEWLFHHWLDGVSPGVDTLEEAWEVWQARAWRGAGGIAGV